MSGNGKAGQGAFGAAVRAERMRRKWSQEALAASAGVSEKTVRRAEAGDPMSRETALSICSVLGLDIDGFGVADPDTRLALPPDDGDAPGVRPVLARRAGPGATVIAVDTQAYIPASLGIGNAEAERAARNARLCAFWEGPACIALVVGALLPGIVFPVLALPVVGAAFLLVGCLGLCGVAGYAMGGYGRKRLMQAVTYRDEMRRTVFSVSGDRLVIHGVDRDGKVWDHTRLFRDGGHRATRIGDRYTFRFALLGGDLEVPCVPATPASEALAASLG